MEIYIANNIWVLRNRNCMTLDELAGAIGVTDKTTIWAYEHGKSYPPLPKLVKLSEIFNCTIDDLIKKKIE